MAALLAVSLQLELVPLAYCNNPPLVGSILFFIRDSETRYGIPNATIEVYENDKLITTLSADDTGHSRFDAKKKGTYVTKVKAEGYRLLEGSNSLEVGGRALELDVMLPPLTLPKELKGGTIEEFEKDAKERGDIIFYGFIVDRKTGKPMEGVQIQAVGSNIKGISNDRGFFLIRYPAPPQPADPDALSPLETYTFEKTGYKTEEFQNEFARPGAHGLYVDMELGSGKNIHKNPHRSLQPVPYPDTKTDKSKEQSSQEIFFSEAIVKAARVLGDLSFVTL
ncbi:MAG TPA: hypothetical protein VEI96_05595 [Thermodesulfovibrionales bacterium]|nr:hypothetical protein [Thermodesulfovibrionales bacterium]